MLTLPHVPMPFWLLVELPSTTAMLLMWLALPMARLLSRLLARLRGRVALLGQLVAPRRPPAA